jgi:hypothetical protein
VLPRREQDSKLLLRLDPDGRRLCEEYAERRSEPVQATEMLETREGRKEDIESKEELSDFVKDDS